MRAWLAGLAVGRPLSLHGPRTATLVVWVITSEMAVFDQSAGGVAAGEMDDFELAHSRLRLEIWAMLEPRLGERGQ